jgi:tRNA modification GTPase
MIYDTIVGVATAVGYSAINVVRLSGVDAIELSSRVFKGKNLLLADSHTVHYGFFRYGDETIDEVMATVFRAPKSFTTEDVVEFSTHGGPYIAQRIVTAFLAIGARLAEPGEFTRRAYLNGRIDLTQAESIMDLINAKTATQLALAHGSLSGTVRAAVESMQAELLDIIAAIEVHIDYPEYDDAEVVTNAIVISKVELLHAKIREAIERSVSGRIIRDGIKTVIVGKPNVGKSSLLNSLLKEDKAIVTEISGTTRDLVEGELRLGGLLLKLIDTAGIRETTDLVEKIGIERTKKALSEADLVLLVLDSSKHLTPEDEILISLTEPKNRIIVGNKVDLGGLLHVLEETIVPVSAKTGIGIERLEQAVRDKFLGVGYNPSEQALFGNVRHIGKLEEASAALSDVLLAANAGEPIDMVEIDLKRAWHALGEITGDVATDDLVTALFAKFCLGK